MLPLPVNIPWRLVGVAAVVILLVTGGMYVYTQGKATGQAQIQAEWDAANKKIAEQVAAQEAKYREKEEADKAAAKEIQRELESRLSESDSRARDLARRLHDYQVRARAMQVPRTSDSPAEPNPPTGGTASDGEIRSAVEGVYAACARDSERLKGWQDWWSKVSP